MLKELDTLIEQQTQLDIKMASFQHMLYVGNFNTIDINPFFLFYSPTLHTLNTNASNLSSSITQTSLLAESVSRKVRVLDIAKVLYI